MRRPTLERKEVSVILKIDRLALELPAPEQPDPNGAAAVQELLGGRFGEMSTFMNYTFQSFNFRGREAAKPYYDLISNISAEEYSHIELVSTTISAMLSGAGENGSRDGKAVDPSATPLAAAKDARISHHYIVGGKGALVANSMAQPWQGDYVFNSGDLVLDLLHNFFLECGARAHKIRVYEMTDHPTARQMIGFLLVRGGVHQAAYAKALEQLTGATVTKLLNIPNIPNSAFPETRQFEERGLHRQLYRFSPEDYRDIAEVWTGPHPEDGIEVEVVEEPLEGAPRIEFPAEPSIGVPAFEPEEIAELARRLAAQTR